MTQHILQLVKTVFAVIAISLCAISCKKLPDGFISNLIRYEEDPIIIEKGRTKVSSALNFDGSSKPVKIKLLHVYEKETGKIVDDIFFKKYQVRGWKQQYNPKTDTTLELIDAKKFDMEIPAIVINEMSGQVEANFNTFDLPSGNYVFDLEITNSAGIKIYPKIGELELHDAPAFESSPELGSAYVRMIKVGNESSGTSVFSNIVVEVARTADKPDKVILKIVDKNGVPFNPKAGEIQRRPSGTTFLQTLQDYSLKTDVFDDRMEFTYGTSPFPLNSLGNGFFIYYRIPTQYFSHDNQASYPDGQFSANPRFPFRCYLPGTYTITFKANSLTHK